MNRSPSDPHADQPVRSAGPSPEQAKAVLVLAHGRGGDAESMLALYRELDVPSVAAIAPQAAARAWYPLSFLAPIETNEPFLSSALRRLEAIVMDLLGRQVPAERIALLGFSQGACLTSELVARHPRRYGAVMVLTGGLIGPPGARRDYAGSLDGTPVFLGASDPDPHVPFARVRETGEVFARMGAEVEIMRYPGMPHTISEDELERCRELLRRMTRSTVSEEHP